MKLGFITHKQDIFNDLGKERTIHNYAVINNTQEAKSYEDQGFLPLASRALQMAEILQVNKDFIQFIDEIKSIRIGLLANTETPKLSLKNFDTSSPEELIQRLEASKRTKRTREALESYYNIDDEVSSQIPTIIHFNCIFLPIIKPEIEISEKYASNNAINITIYAETSINDITNYIEEKKEELRNKMSSLKRKSFFISDRDLYIYQEKERDEKISFRDMTHKVIANFGNGGHNNPNSNPDTLETAYRRAVKKVPAVFNKKETTPS